MYTTVLFIDLDNTIMVNPFESAVWPLVIGEIGLKTGLPYDTVFQMIGEESQQRQADEVCSPVRAMDWDDITETVAQRLGVRLESRVVDLVRENAAAHSSALDNAPHVLRDLARPDRALVVATKGLAKYQLPVLDALGLTALFTDILTPDRHHGLKKHRHFFGDWPARARLAVMVGDLYQDDVLYPTEHGFKTIWKPGRPAIPNTLAKVDPFTRALRYPYTPEQRRAADAIILTLRELPAAVQQLEENRGFLLK